MPTGKEHSREIAPFAPMEARLGSKHKETASARDKGYRKDGLTIGVGRTPEAFQQWNADYIRWREQAQELRAFPSARFDSGRREKSQQALRAQATASIGGCVQLGA